MAKQSEAVVAAVRPSRGPEEVPAAAERTALVARLVAKGFRGQDLAGIIRAGRTRRKIADDLIAQLKTLPKKV